MLPIILWLPVFFGAHCNRTASIVCHVEFVYVRLAPWTLYRSHFTFRRSFDVECTVWYVVLCFELCVDLCILIPWVCVCELAPWTLDRRTLHSVVYSMSSVLCVCGLMLQVRVSICAHITWKAYRTCRFSSFVMCDRSMWKRALSVCNLLINMFSHMLRVYCVVLLCALRLPHFHKSHVILYRNRNSTLALLGLWIAALYIPSFTRCRVYCVCVVYCFECMCVECVEYVCGWWSIVCESMGWWEIRAAKMCAPVYMECVGLRYCDRVVNGSLLLYQKSFLIHIINWHTTRGGGCLGSHIDEERSKLR